MLHEKPVKSLATLLAISLLFVVTGCSHDITTDITKRLILDEIYQVYNVQPKNLSLNSKCANLPTVKIVNLNNRPEEVVKVADTFTVKPKGIIDGTKSYLKGGYEKSSILPSENSTKTLEMKLLSIDLLPSGMWQVGSQVKIELNIPDIKFSKVYEASEYGPAIFTTIVNSVHLVTRKIIDDQAIQDYILCKL